MRSTTRGRIKILEVFCWIAILLVATSAGSGRSAASSHSQAAASEEYIENEGYHKMFMFGVISDFPELKCTSQTSLYNPHLYRMAIIPKKEVPASPSQFLVDGLQEAEEPLRNLLKDVLETAKQGQLVLSGKSGWMPHGDHWEIRYRNQKGEDCYILNITGPLPSAPRERQQPLKDTLAIVDDRRLAAKIGYHLKQMRQFKDGKRRKQEPLVQRNLTPTGVKSSSKISVSKSWSGSQGSSPLAGKIDPKSSESRESSVEESRFQIDGRAESPHVFRSLMSPSEVIEYLESKPGIECDLSHLKTSSGPAQRASSFSNQPPQFSKAHKKRSSVDLGNGDLPGDENAHLNMLHNRTGSSGPDSPSLESGNADSKSPISRQASGSSSSESGKGLVKERTGSLPRSALSQSEYEAAANQYLENISIQSINKFIQSSELFRKCFHYSIMIPGGLNVIKMTSTGLNPIRQALIPFDKELDKSILEWVMDCIYSRAINDSVPPGYEITRKNFIDTTWIQFKRGGFSWKVMFQMQDVIKKSLPQEVSSLDSDKARLESIAHTAGLSILKTEQVSKHCASVEFSNGVKAGRLTFATSYWSPSMEILIFHAIQQILAGNHQDFLLMSPGNSAVGSFVAISDEYEEFEIRDLLNDIHGEVIFWDAGQKAPENDFYLTYFSWSGMNQPDVIFKGYQQEIGDIQKRESSSDHSNAEGNVETSQESVVEPEADNESSSSINSNAEGNVEVAKESTVEPEADDEPMVKPNTETIEADVEFKDVDITIVESADVTNASTETEAGLTEHFVCSFDSDSEETVLTDARPNETNIVKTIRTREEDVGEETAKARNINNVIPGKARNENNLVEEPHKESSESGKTDDFGVYPNENNKTEETEGAESEIEVTEDSAIEVEQPNEDLIPQDEIHEAIIAAQLSDSEEIEVQEEQVPIIKLSKELASDINPDVESHEDVVDLLREQSSERNPDDEESVDEFPLILARNPVMPQTKRMKSVDYVVTDVDTSKLGIPTTLLDSLVDEANVSEPENIMELFQGEHGRSLISETKIGTLDKFLLESETRIGTLDMFSLENEAGYGTLDKIAEAVNAESQEIIVRVMLPKNSNYLRFSLSKVSRGEISQHHHWPSRPSKEKICWKLLRLPKRVSFHLKIERGKLYTIKMTKSQFVKLSFALKNYLSRMKESEISEIPEIYPLEYEQHQDLPSPKQEPSSTGLMQRMRYAFYRAKSLNFSALKRSLSSFKKPEFPKVVPKLKKHLSKTKKPESRSLTSRVMSSLPFLPKWPTFKDAPKEPAPLTKGTKPSMLALTYCGENEEEIEISSHKNGGSNPPTKKEKPLVLRNSPKGTKSSMPALTYSGENEEEIEIDIPETRGSKPQTEEESSLDIGSRPSIPRPSGEVTRTSSTRSRSASLPSSRASSSPASVSPPLPSSKIHSHQIVAQDDLVWIDNEFQTVVSDGGEEAEVLEMRHGLAVTTDPVAHPLNANESRTTSSSMTLQEIIRHLNIQDDDFISPDDDVEEAASSDDEELDDPKIDLYWLNRSKNTTSSGSTTPLNGNSKSAQASKNISSSPQTKELSKNDDEASSEEANDNRSTVEKWLFPKPTPAKRADGIVPTHPSESESDWTDSEDDGLTWIERQQKEEREVEEIFHVGHLFMGGSLINFGLISLLLLL